MYISRRGEKGLRHVNIKDYTTHVIKMLAFSYLLGSKVDPPVSNTDASLGTVMSLACAIHIPHRVLYVTRCKNPNGEVSFGRERGGEAHVKVISIRAFYVLCCRSVFLTKVNPRMVP